MDFTKFIQVWNNSENAKEVSQKFNISIKIVRSHRNKLRRKGHFKTFRKGFKPKLTRDEFLKIYNESSSKQEVVEKTGYSIHTVQHYATILRKKGHNLKS